MEEAVTIQLGARQSPFYNFHPIFLRYILILSSQIPLRLPSVSPDWHFERISHCPMHAACHANLTFLDCIVWEGHVARIGEMRSAYKILVREPEGKSSLGGF
jgi:hypothetical protein